MCSLSDDKWVRIMCDYCADGVWAKSGGAALPEDLPVSEVLRNRIRSWQAWYEESAGQDDGSWVDLAAFAEEGEAIARAVKAELPDWTVIYHNEAKLEDVFKLRRVFGRVEVPRSHFEYEVT